MASSKKNLLAANWKMKLLSAKAQDLAGKLRDLAAGLRKSEIWVAPSFTAIPAVASAVKASAVRLGAQNAFGAAEGAFTGEISVAMLKEFGCEFAIIGHSERRLIFGESNELTAERAAAVLGQNFGVIFCVGETQAQRAQNLTGSILREQMSALLDKLQAEESAQLVIAYEPVWAIGTGVVANTAEISEAHSTIAAIWQEKFSAPPPAILYGGSVTAANFAEIIALDLVSGALIGGASLTFESMQALAAISEA